MSLKTEDISLGRWEWAPGATSWLQQQRAANLVSFVGLESDLIALGDEFVGSVDDFMVGATSFCSDIASVFSKLWAVLKTLPTIIKEPTPRIKIWV